MGDSVAPGQDLWVLGSRWPGRGRMGPGWAPALALHPSPRSLRGFLISLILSITFSGHNSNIEDS